MAMDLSHLIIVIIALAAFVYAIIVSSENRRLRDDRHNFNNLTQSLNLLNHRLKDLENKNDKN